MNLSRIKIVFISWWSVVTYGRNGRQVITYKNYKMAAVAMATYEILFENIFTTAPENFLISKILFRILWIKHRK